MMENDAAYWDAYADQWRSDGDQASLLGAEWTGREVFVEVLKRHGDPAKTALEIGCGGGRITQDAARSFQHVHACDISGKMLARARASLPTRNLSFHRIDGFSLALFADRSIDLVYSHDVFVHFSALQVYPYYREIRRILKPGGKVIVSFYNYLVHFALFKELALSYNAARISPPAPRIHFLTEEILDLILCDLGFQLLERDAKNYLIDCSVKPANG